MDALIPSQFPQRPPTSISSGVSVLLSKREGWGWIKVVTIIGSNNGFLKREELCFHYGYCNRTSFLITWDNLFIHTCVYACIDVLLSAIENRFYLFQMFTVLWMPLLKKENMHNLLIHLFCFLGSLWFWVKKYPFSAENAWITEEGKTRRQWNEYCYERSKGHEPL